jgi:hypothetical protein
MQPPLLDARPVFLVVRCQAGLPESRIDALFGAFKALPGVVDIERFSDLTGLTTAQLMARITPPRKQRRRAT